MSSAPPPDRSTVFVVSGGARGITAQCVVALARSYACRFILLGRTPPGEAEPAWAVACADEAALKQQIAVQIAARGEKPAPLAIQRQFDALAARRAIAATLRAVAEAGGSAEYVCADVADGPALAAALAEAQSGPITGVIHGAGVLADRLIEQKRAADFDTVYAPKVHGLRNLLACVDPDRLRYLVLFSSAAGFYGNVGQSDYAVANEILNKAAYQIKRAHPACRVLTLNWGPWDSGMVTPALKALFAQRRIGLIAPEAGARVLVDALASEQPALQLVVGDALAPPPQPLDAELRSYCVSRRLTLADNPFLRDHIVGGHAVLPATCAMAWMADVCEQRYPGYRLFRCAGYQVLKGIVFDDSLADRYTLDLRETAKSEAEGEVCFDVQVSSQTEQGRPRYHYRAQITLRRELPAAPLYPDVDLREQNPLDGAPLYRDGTLFHGPCFRGIERVLSLGRQRVTARCRLPPLSAAQQGQFPARAINPFVVDAQLQCLVIWARQIYGAASLPSGIALGEQFRAIPFGEQFYVTLDVRSDGEHRLSADIAAHDAQGRIHQRLCEASVIISRQLNRLFATAP